MKVESLWPKVESMPEKVEASAANVEQFKPIVERDLELENTGTILAFSRKNVKPQSPKVECISEK